MIIFQRTKEHDIIIILTINAYVYIKILHNVFIPLIKIVWLENILFPEERHVKSITLQGDFSDLNPVENL